MSKIEVTGFDDRIGDLSAGFIEFNDGMRIGYAPGTIGPNEDGLFDPEQPYLLRGKEMSPQHWLIATEWARKHLKKD